MPSSSTNLLKCTGNKPNICPFQTEIKYSIASQSRRHVRCWTGFLSARQCVYLYGIAASAADKSSCPSLSLLFAEFVPSVFAHFGELNQPQHASTNTSSDIIKGNIERSLGGTFLIKSRLIRGVFVGKNNSPAEIVGEIPMMDRA